MRQRSNINPLQAHSVCSDCLQLQNCPGCPCLYIVDPDCPLCGPLLWPPSTVPCNHFNFLQPLMVWSRSFLFVNSTLNFSERELAYSVFGEVDMKQFPPALELEHHNPPLHLDVQCPSLAAVGVQRRPEFQTT